MVSIQFHDITRQQVEHVIEVLRRLCSESQEVDKRSSRDTGTAAVLALQSSQLSNAGEKFAASVQSLTSNLDDIAAHVSKIAEESRVLFSDSEDEKDSCFVQMANGCTAIVDRLSRCASAEAAARTTGGTLVKTIGRMREAIEEVGPIESQMFLVAINARITFIRREARN